MPVRRPCIEHSCPNFAERGSRCPQHERQLQSQRNASRSQYAGGWDAFAKQAIAAYRAEHGDVCPGFGRSAHAVIPTAWTCDHDLGPLCRPCNSRKGATVDRRRAEFLRLIDRQR